MIDRPGALQGFLADFIRISGRKILVHGGGSMASDVLVKGGIPVRIHEGRRITDEAVLRVCTMVYAGWINKTIVAQLQALHCNAIGLSGVDGNVLTAARRPPVPVDYGYVGDVAPGGVEVESLAMLMEHGFTPVLCAITHDGRGGLLNTNADTLAAMLAIALTQTCAVKLIFCFEKQGVLAVPDDEASVVPTLTPAGFLQLKNAGVITEGMIPKLDNAFAAIAAGVEEVHIKHAENLLTAKGTVICRQVEEDC